MAGDPFGGDMSLFDRLCALLRVRSTPGRGSSAARALDPDKRHRLAVSLMGVAGGEALTTSTADLLYLKVQRPEGQLVVVAASGRSGQELLEWLEDLPTSPLSEQELH